MADTGIATITLIAGRKVAAGIVNAGSQISFDKLVIAWQSDASGNVVKSNAANVCGFLARAKFIPSATVAPTTYGVTFVDEEGIDVLNGTATGLSATDSSQVVPTIPMKDGTTTSTTYQAINDTMTFNVTGAGANKLGKTVFYIR